MSGPRSCPSCGKDVRPNARFCGGCGATLAAGCPACGAPVDDSSAQFCEHCGSPLAARSAARPAEPIRSVTSGAPPPGNVPESLGAGRYEVRRFLGEGGRKRVYQACDRALDRDVAVATVKTEDLDAAGLQRVRREAQARGRLGDHPHIVTVYDIGEEDGRPFIVSQYMPGGSVDDLLADAAYACASASGIIASWQLARQGLMYAGPRDVAWARLTCFDYQRREAEETKCPGIPIDSAERREAAAILRAAGLDPIAPAPMEAVFDSRQDAAECSNLIVAAVWGGAYSRSLPPMEAEARQAEALGRLARAARAWANVAFYQTALGALPEAGCSLERADDLAARLGTPIPTVIWTRHLLCAALDEGWVEMAATFSFLASADNPALAWARGFAYSGQAQAAARLNRPEEAIAAVGRLLPWLEQAPPWTIAYPNMAYGAAEALWLLGRVDHGDMVEWALREKLLPADFRGMVDGRQALARLCALTGRHDEAQSWFGEARRRLEEEGSRPLRAVCDFDEALMYARRDEPGDINAARPLLKAARRQFEDIGMTGWLRRADELEAQLG